MASWEADNANTRQIITLAKVQLTRRKPKYKVGHDRVYSMHVICLTLLEIGLALS